MYLLFSGLWTCFTSFLLDFRAGQRQFLLLLLLLGTGFIARAQAPGSRQLAPDGTPQFIRLARAVPGPVGGGAVVASDPLPVLRRELALMPNDELRLLRTETDELGFTHVRYQQYYQGVKVEHGVYSAHSRNGQVETLSGELKRPARPAVQPALSATVARQRALAAVGATRYMWQNPAEEASLKQQQNDPNATYYPTGELVLVEDYRQSVAIRPLVLAWKFDIYAQQPISRAYYYIDARTGKVVLVDALIKHADGLAGPLHAGAAGRRVSTPASTRRVAANATGSFATRYSGAQTAGTESITGGYRLHDPSRGNGVNTYNALKNNSYSAASEFTDADNNWTAAEYNNANYDNAALDAHWGAQGVYDYWLNVHGRNSFNGSGATINSYVHYDDTPGDGKGYENAFWDGTRMTYGDGQTQFNPLTALDVCGHEIGHAVCAYTANLVYQNESGGLNEGFSDIWGACVEYYNAPGKQTWRIAEDLVTTANATAGYNCLRSLSDPGNTANYSRCPSYYGGTRWVAPVAIPSSSNDRGGVHTNSGVLNYWFYLVSQGSASGINDGHAFNAITGISIDKAAKIAYRAERIYLTANSDFAAARTATLQAAADLYGVPERTAVAQAWFAVGLGEPAPTFTSFVQTSGPVGEPVTLTGTNFLTAFSVRFNGLEASSFTVNSATSITAIVPSGATNGTLAVQTPSGTATNAGIFTLTVRPNITAISPASAASGVSIVISGTNFVGATAVTFSSNVVVAAGSFTLNTSVNPNTITVTVPGAAATGPVTVTTNAASTGFAFTVTPFTLVARDPVRQALQATLAGPVNLTFSQAPGATTGAGTPIGIFSSQRGGRRNGSGTFSSTGNVVTYTPGVGTPFQPGEVVSVTTTSAATSTGGTALLVPETYQFTAAAGRATATLGAATATSVGTQPQNVAIGDVNGDGFQDAVVANTNQGSGTTVSVRLGNGAGGFGGTTDLPVGTGPQTVVLADVNNDGRLDIVVACPNAAAIYVLVRNATGSTASDFAAATSVSTTVAASGLAVADFNNDGWLDLVAANAYSNAARVCIFLNTRTAAGTFAANAILTDLQGGYCGGVAAADMNNDGKMDLLIANGSGSGNSFPNTVTVATGDGAGSFTAQATGLMGTDPRTLAVGDINNDGKPDFITANQTSGNVSVRLGDGAGGFTAPTTPEITVGASQQPQQVALADLNGDGNLDFVATNYYANPGKVSIRLGAGNGSFSTPATPEYNAGSQCWGLAVADVNSDGALDVVTADWGTTTMSVLLNTPLPKVVSISPNSGVSGSSVTIYGSGFVAGSMATIGGVALGSLVVNTAAQTIAGTVGASSPLGAQPVVVTTSVGASNATVQFTVLNPAPPLPAISSLSPVAELPGQSVVLTGSNFTSGSSVSFGGVAAAGVTYVSATSLTVIVPVGAGATVSVTTPAGTSPTSAFTLLAVADASTLVVNTCTTATAVTNAADSNWHYLLVSGQVVLAYNTQGRDLGTVSAELLRANPALAVRQDGRNHAYLGRNWHLTTSAGTFVGSSVLVRFYALTSEYTQLQAAASTEITSLASLRVTQYAGANEDCQLNNNVAAGERRLLTPTSTSGPASSNFFVSETLVADHFSEFYLNGGTNPLPVELSAFTATLAGTNAVRLAWTTASEQNSARFEVERSLNGTVFDRIGTVAAAGSSSTPRTYDFTDSKLPSTVLLYYRLLQVDQDGSFSYSPVRTVAGSGQPVQVWTLVPNPARATMLTGATAGASVLVFDILGRLVLTAKADAAGTAKLVLPASLRAGIYLVRSGSHATRLAVE